MGIAVTAVQSKHVAEVEINQPQRIPSDTLVTGMTMGSLKQPTIVVPYATTMFYRMSIGHCPLFLQTLHFLPA